MVRLSDRERQALHLADALRQEVWAWMTSRNVAAPFMVTPFVDPAGRPNVLIRLDAALALAMIHGLHEQHPRPDWPSA